MLRLDAAFTLYMEPIEHVLNPKRGQALALQKRFARILRLLYKSANLLTLDNIDSDIASHLWIKHYTTFGGIDYWIQDRQMRNSHFLDLPCAMCQNETRYCNNERRKTGVDIEVARI